MLIVLLLGGTPATYVSFQAWDRSPATAPIQPLTWELPYATGTALKKINKKFKKPFILSQVIITYYHFP